MAVKVDKEELYLMIKKIVTEVLEEEKYKFFLKSIPEISKDEMSEIEKSYGSKPEKKESAFNETIEI
ncbi:MAG: hypothetical protein OEZ22_12505 [Spirochaetia bacterium]|nr:hypothetical protein [Spirochaetia bacterium]